MSDERRSIPKWNRSVFSTIWGLEHIQTTTGHLLNFRPRLGEEVKSRSKVFEPGDVLYGRLRPNLNKVYLAEGADSFGICSTEFFVLIPKAHLVGPQMLRALLASRQIQEAATKRMSGTALPRISRSDFLDMTVPVPPLDLQMKYEKFLTDQNAPYRQWAASYVDPESIRQAVETALCTGGIPVQEA